MCVCETDRPRNRERETQKHRDTETEKEGCSLITVPIDVKLETEDRFSPAVSECDVIKHSFSRIVDGKCTVGEGQRRVACRWTVDAEHVFTCRSHFLITGVGHPAGERQSVHLRGRKCRQRKGHREGFTKVVERVRNFGRVGQPGFAWKTLNRTMLNSTTK